MQGDAKPYQKTTETIDRDARPTFVDRFVTWICSVRTQLYIAHSLQAWGDRMWVFSMGLFLVHVTGTLRAAALAATAMAASLVLFSHVIGYWIDLAHRLNVIRGSILVQNVCVILTNILIFIALKRKDRAQPHTSSADVTGLLVGVVGVAVVGRLSSVASNISIQKDWVVVLAHAGHAALTDMNAMMRRIDMVCNIAAPIFIGLWMSWPGLKFAALLVVAWNCVSALAEYCLLVKVYVSEPLLTHKQSARQIRLQQTSDLDEQQSVPVSDTSKVPIGASPLSYKGEQGFDDSFDDPATAGENGLLERVTRYDLSNVTIRTVQLGRSEQDSFAGATLSKMTVFFTSFADGFKIYISYPVKFAGFGLALLFLTVLGFNSVTNGYLLLNGLPVTYISFIMAGGSVCGIVGTLVFPRLKTRIGLERATLAGIGFQLCCLSLCVLAMFCPGTLWHALQPDTPPACVAQSPQLSNESLSLSPEPAFNSSSCHPRPERSRVSVALFAFGLLASRAGLWTFDLGVVQLIQEAVSEGERGRFNAFQQSLQSLFDLAHLILVAVLPNVDTFAWLVFMSFCAVSTGSLVFIYYCFSEGVTLFPCLQSSTPSVHVHVPEDNLPPLGGVLTVSNNENNASGPLINRNYDPARDSHTDA